MKFQIIYQLDKLHLCKIKKVYYNRHLCFVINKNCLKHNLRRETYIHIKTTLVASYLYPEFHAN